MTAKNFAGGSGASPPGFRCKAIGVSGVQSDIPGRGIAIFALQVLHGLRFRVLRFRVLGWEEILVPKP